MPELERLEPFYFLKLQKVSNFSRHLRILLYNCVYHLQGKNILRMRESEKNDIKVRFSVCFVGENDGDTNSCTADTL